MYQKNLNNSLQYLVTEDEYQTEDEEEEEEEEDYEDDIDSQAATARPRRMSEIRAQNNVKPIPQASSLFMFAPTNK